MTALYKINLYDLDRNYLGTWPWRGTSLPSLAIWQGEPKRYFAPNPASLQSVYAMESKGEVEIAECDYVEILAVAEIGRL